MLGDTMADIFSMLKRPAKQRDYKVGQYYVGFTTMADSLYPPNGAGELFVRISQIARGQFLRQRLNMLTYCLSKFNSGIIRDIGNYKEHICLEISKFVNTLTDSHPHIRWTHGWLIPCLCIRLISCTSDQLRC